ncbi:DUF5994 family protein [Streptomyces sp. NPDC085946]|uniref:DUF5994 family protein n=1 Tax=Streptomyces sp. NPDC085946 TaxID=3365744 RepID=UPI0037CDF601
MPDADPPPPAGLLADGAYASVRPGTALLRLSTTPDRRGVLDGAWWPRSRDATVELPGLVGALTERLGPVTRIGLDAAAWEELPTRMTIDGRVVHIDSFPVGDDTALVTRGDQDLFSLLVIPPDASPETARAATAEALRTGNLRQAEQILVDTAGDRGGGA